MTRMAWGLSSRAEEGAFQCHPSGLVSLDEFHTAIEAAAPVKSLEVPSEWEASVACQACALS